MLWKVMQINDLCLQIETETKWPPFSRRYFQMHFLEWKCMNFEWDFTELFPKGQITKIRALVQMMAWRRIGDEPLSEPVIVILLTHICVTRPQWGNKCHWDMTKINRINFNVRMIFEWNTISVCPPPPPPQLITMALIHQQRTPLCGNHSNYSKMRNMVSVAW